MGKEWRVFYQAGDWSPANSPLAAELGVIPDGDGAADDGGEVRTDYYAVVTPDLGVKLRGVPERDNEYSLEAKFLKQAHDDGDGFVAGHWKKLRLGRTQGRTADAVAATLRAARDFSSFYFEHPTMIDGLLGLATADGGAGLVWYRVDKRRSSAEISGHDVEICAMTITGPDGTQSEYHGLCVEGGGFDGIKKVRDQVFGSGDAPAWAHVGGFASFVNHIHGGSVDLVHPGDGAGETSASTSTVGGSPSWSDEETEARTKLAALYRIAAFLGWDEIIYNHCSLRVPGPDKHFLLNPLGIGFDEIRASDLVKVDLDGTVIDPGASSYTFNPSGYVIHSAIHAARDDLHCLIHTHSPPGVAVSAMQCGLLPISQHVFVAGPVSYHPYEGITTNPEERERMVASLGDTNKCLIFENHGLLTGGATVEEAFWRMYSLDKACQVQVCPQTTGGNRGLIVGVMAMGAGLDNLTIVDEDVAARARAAADGFNPEGIGRREFEAMVRRMSKALGTDWKQ